VTIEFSKELVFLSTVHLYIEVVVTIIF